MKKLLPLLALAFASCNSDRTTSSDGPEALPMYPQATSPVGPYSPVAEKDADFYVAPDGDDSSQGTLQSPFATLARARDAVRELKQSKSEDITVYLRGGRYEIAETITFSLRDGGTSEQSITYAAYPGEVPILSAGREILEWEKPNSPVENLPQTSQSQVLVADIDESFRALFDAEGILPRAKSEMFITKKGGSRTKMIIPDSHYKEWSNLETLEFAARPHHAWIVNILPVVSADHDTKSLTSNDMATYSMNPLHFLPEVPNAWVENAIEELDEPGEWVLNPITKKLYLWPRNESTVYHAGIQEVIKIEGEIDYAGATDTPVTNLRFHGLTFKHGERYQVDADDLGVQHEWDFVDKANALIRLRGTEQCAVTDCHFLHSGSNAIRVDLHGMQNEISGNHIEHLGGSGISLIGYGPGSKDVNRKNFVSNNHIHHVGEIYWHSSGILLSQSGENQISNNLIHHTNYTGLIISGVVLDFFRKNARESSKTVRWDEIGGKRRALTAEEAAPYLHTHDNIIELNEIHHAMQKLGDGNAIYIRGAGAGNIIRRNYVHDLVTPMIMQCAIRTDGGQRDTQITENIIYRCMSQGMLLKLENRFENNILVDILCPPRGYFLSVREGPFTSSVQKNIFYASGEYETVIHELDAKRKNSTEDARGRPLARIEDGDVENNLYYSELTPEKMQAELKSNQEKGKNLNSIHADPLFTDLENGDFTLQSGSPAFDLGFKQINQSRIGLLSQ